MEFSAEQEIAIALIQKNQNVFISGPAGTGKSTILKFLQKEDPKLPVTATTGMAAVNVGGITINSWAGLGILEDSPEMVASRILRQYPKAKKSIRQSHRVALDEVSILNAKALDTMDRTFQIVRGNSRPFGGIQMVLFGDFLQLPPISKNKKEEMAFKARAWESIQTVILSKVFRQEDAHFAKVLNDLRMGVYTAEAGALLQARALAVDPEEQKPAVVVHSHNQNVELLNYNELKKLPGNGVSYKAADEGRESVRKSLASHCIAPTTLSLKEGARVMLLRNLDQKLSLVNGSMGTLVGFTEGGHTMPLPIVAFDNGVTKIIGPHTWEVKDAGEKLGERQQIPLKLGWAITIHKIQGATLDKARVYLDQVFEEGQAYVALSRVRTPEGLFVASGDRSCIRANKTAVEFYRKHTRGY